MNLDELVFEEFIPIKNENYAKQIAYILDLIFIRKNENSDYIFEQTIDTLSYQISSVTNYEILFEQNRVRINIRLVHPQLIKILRKEKIKRLI